MFIRQMLRIQVMKAKRYSAVQQIDKGKSGSIDREIPQRTIIVGQDKCPVQPDIIESYRCIIGSMDANRINLSQGIKRLQILKLIIDTGISIGI